MDYNSLQSPDRAANLVDRKKIGMLVAKKYDGVRIERRDQSRINDLPKGQKDRLVTHGLLEGKPDIPTLSGLIDYYHKRYAPQRAKVPICGTSVSIAICWSFFLPLHKRTVSLETVNRFGMTTTSSSTCRVRCMPNWECVFFPKIGRSGVREKLPSNLPFFSRSDMAFWAKFDDSTPSMEIALALCEANGLPMVESRKMLEKDGRVDVFGGSIKSIRQSVYDYSQGKISQMQLLFRAFGFLGRVAYEFIREIIITPSRLSQSNGARRT